MRDSKPLRWNVGTLQTPLARRTARIDEDAVIVVHGFDKKTAETPDRILALCRERLREYDHGR